MIVTTNQPSSDCPDLKGPYLLGIMRQLQCICHRLEEIEAHFPEPQPYLKEQLVNRPLKELLQPRYWLVLGRVTNSQGNPLSDVEISIFDQDLNFDERLGSIHTDPNGYFYLAYNVEDFQELAEANIDLYLKVLDPKGEEICLIETPVKFQAGWLEQLKIIIPDAVSTE